MSGIIEQILGQVEGDTLIVAPKSAMASISRKLESLEVNFEKEQNMSSLDERRALKKNGYNIYLTNHGRDIGSNAYRVCSEIIYLGLHHIPMRVAVADTLYHLDGPITSSTLEDASGQRLKGLYESYQKGKLQDEFKQMLARGTCRIVETDGKAKRMRAWCLLNNGDDVYADLQNLFPNCTVSPPPDGITYVSRNPTSVRGKIILTLESLPEDVTEITSPDLEHEIRKLLSSGPTLKNHAAMMPTYLQGSGWHFERSALGKGPHKFKRDG